MSKLLLWFGTQRGKIFTRTCVGAIGASIFGVQIAMHGPMQNKFREMCQIYRDGKGKPISSYLHQLIKDVIRDCDLKKEEKRKLKFFNVVGLDLFHFGGTNSPWGAMVGVPFYFDDRKEINFAELQLVGHEQLDWIIEGQDLFDALSLSDNAKKFALMRELYSCDIWSVLDNASISSGIFLFMAEFARRMNIRRNSFETLGIRGRVFFYFSCHLFGFFLYKCFKDPMKHLKDKKSDQTAATIKPEYLEGGIEFYQKQLLRNKALRQLLGSKGESMYDKNGNENYLILTPRLPTRVRLDLLEELKRELKAVPA